jgi:hypothetical protein
LEEDLSSCDRMSTSKGKEVDSSAGDDEEELVRPEKYGANIATINYLEKRIAKSDVSASNVSAVEAAVNRGFDKLTDHLTALPGQLASAITQLNHKGHSQAPMQEPRLNGSLHPRQETCDVQPHQGETQYRKESKIKRDNIGEFDPHFEDPEDLGMIKNGTSLVFTDVLAFSEQINTLLECENTRAVNEAHILDLFPTLLNGVALLWWNYELPASTRQELRDAGLHAIMIAMQDRFSTDPAIATINSSRQP